MLTFNLSEMKGEDGSSLRYKAESTARLIAIQLSEEAERLGCFTKLYNAMPSPRLILYFQFLLKAEIFPTICEAIAIEWRRRHDREMLTEGDRVVVPDEGVFPYLKRHWTIDAPMEVIPALRFYAIKRDLAKKMIFGQIRHSVAGVKYHCTRRLSAQNPKVRTSPEGMIACHFTEGLEYDKRNDLSWFPESGINPRHVLIYFDTFDPVTEKPISRALIEEIEQSGFSWVVLRRGVVEGGNDHYWSPSRKTPRLIIPHTASSSFEKWMVDKAHELIRSVHYWKSFYEAFNVRISYVPEEGLAENIAQAIAFDVITQKPGVLVGKQRSELFSLHSDDVGYHPKHVFFVWNKRAISVLRENHDCIEQFVISGYPYAHDRQNSEGGCAHYAEAVRKNGAKFVVALFDNMHGTLKAHSSNLMERFFKLFLRLVIDDPTFGLVIKSKKPAVINRLPAIYSLLEKALATGRCARLDAARFKAGLPVNIAYGADISVGIGISSAVIEAVAAGLRGVLYDAQTIRSHEFYTWGNRKVIFEDLDELLESLIRYKSDTKNVSSFGDWSAHIDEIDYFHDTRGNARMGQYIRLVFEGLCKMNDRQSALSHARKRYIEKWGDGTVLTGERSEHGKEPKEPSFF